MTHAATDAALAATVADLRPLDIVRAVASVMRVEGESAADVARTHRGVPGPAPGHRRRPRSSRCTRGTRRSLPAPELSDRTGCDVYLKVEGANPTGSFKDRGMTVAVSKAVEAGRQGDHLRLDRQHLRVGRRVRRPGRADLRRAHPGRARSPPASWPRRSCTAPARCRSPATSTTASRSPPSSPLDYPVALVNSVNTDRLHGQKTAAFEIVEALGDAPDIHCLPVGNAGNISAYWMGYQEDHARRQHHPAARRCTGSRPAAPPRSSTAQVVREPSTIATAIRIGNPASWTKAIDARDASGGLIRAVTDREILSAYRLLARQVGVFVELGSAASVAGLLAASAAGDVPRGSTVVCTVTGHGLKDPEWAISTAPPPVSIRNDVLAAARALDLA